MYDWKNELTTVTALKDMDEFDIILNSSIVQEELKNVHVWHPLACPIHTAASHGHKRMLKRLIEAGADPNADLVWKEGCRVKPIHLAIRGNHVRAVKLLVKNGAKVDAYGKYGKCMSNSGFNWV